MKIDSWSIINYTVFFLCLITTIGLSIYSISRYCANEDLTMVNIVKYHSSEDRLYPSFTMCIYPPFLEKKFERFQREDINMSSYIKFLDGEIWDERMLAIDYDNVTISFSDNLLDSKYYTKNREDRDWNPVHHVSYRFPWVKCFTIDAPLIDNEVLTRLEMHISNDIFPNKKRSHVNKLFTYFHYPGQLFSGIHTYQYYSDPRENMTKSYKMWFSIKNVHSISRRNKPRGPCVTDWKHFDELIMKKLMIEIGCRPSHWTLSGDVPLCKNASQMKKFTKQPHIVFDNIGDPPCKFFDLIYYTSDENDIDEEQYNL